MLRRCLFVVVFTVAAVMTSTIPAAAAVRPFNPPQTLVGGCPSFSGDAVTTAGGKLLGFATCPSPSGESIRFFSRNPDGTVNPSEASGFFGRVLGVSYDNTATYVLFQADVQLRIGKRTHAGAFSSRVVDTTSGGFTGGDVIARNGQWFGVWSEQAALGFGQTDLFSAGSALPIRRVTTTNELVDDVEPTLAYSASTPVLIWSRRQGGGQVDIRSDLYVTKFVAGTWQRERVFASAGNDNFWPDMQIVAGRTFVTWNRDEFIWAASNPTGSFVSRRFNTSGGGLRPFVAVSNSGNSIDHIFLTWTSFSQDRVFFAESASSGTVTGTWQGTHIGPPGSVAFATGGFNTKGTAVYGTGTSVASRTQA